MAGRRRAARRSAPNDEECTRFLNLDLDLVSDRDLSTLLVACSKSVTVLRDSVDDGVHTLWLELRRQPKDVGHAIRGFFALFESLLPSARRLWNGCSDRCLNIGIQAGQEPHAQMFVLSNDSVVRARAMRARFVITVYGARCR